MVQNYISMFIYLPIDIQISQYCWEDYSFFTELSLCSCQRITIHICVDCLIIFCSLDLFVYIYIYTSILEKETYSSFLPEKSHGQRELGRLQSNGSQRVGHNWVTKHTHQYHTGLITVVFESLNQVVLVFIFSWVVLAIVGPLYLHMNFKITLSISTNKAAGILSDIALSLSIYLGEN